MEDAKCPRRLRHHGKQGKGRIPQLPPFPALWYPTSPSHWTQPAGGHLTGDEEDVPCSDQPSQEQGGREINEYEAKRASLVNQFHTEKNTAPVQGRLLPYLEDIRCHETVGQQWVRIDPVSQCKFI